MPIAEIEGLSDWDVYDCIVEYFGIKLNKSYRNPNIKTMARQYPRTPEEMVIINEIRRGPMRVARLPEAPEPAFTLDEFQAAMDYLVELKTLRVDEDGWYHMNGMDVDTAKNGDVYCGHCGRREDGNRRKTGRQTKFRQDTFWAHHECIAKFSRTHVTRDQSREVKV